MLQEIPNTRLSAQLKSIAARCRTERVTLREVMQALRGSSTLLFISLLCLPFLPIVSPPGVSIPFGIIIAIFGVHLTLGQQPIIPDKFLNVVVPRRFFPAFLEGAGWLLRGIEFFSRPRWHLLIQTPLLLQFYGLVILLSAILLMMPLPIPFANSLPALTILLFALAMIERDGLLVLLGALSFVTTLGYFTFLILGGKALLEKLLQ